MADPDLVTIQTASGVPFTVAREHADKFKAFLDDPGWGDYALDAKQSGGYNPRNIAGTNTPSQHAFGRAIDLNWNDNPRGGAGKIPPDLARSLAQKHGLTWGGDWKNPDPMHFEIGSGSPVPMASRGIASFAGAAPASSSPITAALASPPSPGRSPMADYSYDTAGMSPEEVAAKRQRANQLFGMVQDYRPNSGLLGALAQAFSGYESGRVGREAAAGEAAGRGSTMQALQDALTSKTPQAAIAAGLATPYGSMLAPIASQAIQSQIQQGSPQAQTELEAQRLALEQSKATNPIALERAKVDLKNAQEKDWLNELIKKRMPGLDGASPSVGAPAQPLPQGGPVPPVGAQPMPGMTVSPPAGLQKVGAQGGVMPGGVTLAQNAPPSAAPTSAAKPAEMVDTPLGKMTRDDARFLGFAFAAKKNSEASKIFMDAAGPQEGHTSTPFAHDLDKAEMGLTNLKGAFNEIQRIYDPSYLKGGPKMTFFVNNILDKWTPDSWKALKPEAKTALAGYEKFVATSMNNLNTRLKELSGTAVTESEMQRILRELPSPGTSPFSGDGPTAFKAKLDQGQRMAIMAIARTRYLRANGFKGDVNAASTALPLDDIPKLIDRRGAEILQKMKQENPGVPEEKLQPLADQATAREFGI